MARPATGNVKVETHADGTLAFRLRFPAYGRRETLYLHERRDCGCGCGGGWNERTASVELRNILARVQADIWEPPSRAPSPSPAPSPHETPMFEDYASYWLQAKLDGVLGEKPLGRKSHQNYRWRMRHLLAFFARYRLDEIDRDLCLDFKAHKIQEARELRDALAAGADIRDPTNKRAVPLSPASIKKLISALGSILDEAVEDGYIQVNPARGRRMRIHVPKPRRTFLEIDELVCVEEAAAEQDPPLALYAQAAREAPHYSTPAAIALRISEGMRQEQIARELGLAKSTVSFHLTRLGLGPTRYRGRRAIVCTLGRSGVRVSELCDMRIGHLRLHDPQGARFHIPDAKTEKGIREVLISPDHAEQLIMHIDRLRRGGRDTGPEAWLFQNERGGRMDVGRVAKILAEAAVAASATLEKQGMPALPHITPHSLRRTYISIALLANNFDVRLGHEPGRTRRLQDDPRGLRAAAATRQARPRRRVRQAHPRRP